MNQAEIEDALQQLEIYYYLCCIIEQEKQAINQPLQETLLDWLFMKATFMLSHLAYWKNNLQSPDNQNSSSSYLAAANRFTDNLEKRKSVIHKWMLFSSHLAKETSQHDIGNHIMHDLYRSGGGN